MHSSTRVIDVVIVNWNAGGLLADCVQSIYQTDRGLVDKVIVVDNASSDGSLAAIRGLGDRTHVIETGANLGFARGCNVGAAAGKAPWIVFLNPDTRLFDGTLDTVADFLRLNGLNLGVVGIRLVDEDGKTQRTCARFPSVRHYIGLGLGLDRTFPRAFPPHFMEDFDHLEGGVVDQPIGAFNAIDRELFERLGGFDEVFFVYMEDIDLARRASASGRPSFHLGTAVAYHKGGGTSSQAKAKRLFYNLRSRIIYAFKTFGLVGACAVTLATVTSEFVARCLKGLVQGTLRETLAGYALLWRDTPNTARAAWAARERGPAGALRADWLGFAHPGKDLEAIEPSGS